MRVDLASIKIPVGKSIVTLETYYESGFGFMGSLKVNNHFGGEILLRHKGGMNRYDEEGYYQILMWNLPLLVDYLRNESPELFDVADEGGGGDSIPFSD